MADFIGVAETISQARRGMLHGECLIDARVADAALPAGVFVTVGSTQYSCKVPAASADVTQKILGCATYLAMREPATSGTNEYAAADVVNYVKDGTVWAIVEGTPTDGAQVFVRYAAGGGGSQLGACRVDADTATAAALTNAKFVGAPVTVAGTQIMKVAFKIS